jgi:hypothetical protein
MGISDVLSWSNKKYALPASIQLRGCNAMGNQDPLEKSNILE